jgi:flagellar hook protein FlgE
MNPISTASAGIVSGLSRFDSASQAVVDSVSGQSNTSTAGAVVDQITAVQQVQASTATLKVADQMMKALLDIKV